MGYLSEFPFTELPVSFRRTFGLQVELDLYHAFLLWHCVLSHLHVCNFNFKICMNLFIFKRLYKIIFHVCDCDLKYASSKYEKGRALNFPLYMKK